LAPDLRGHGRSEWDPPWTIATYVADVLETVVAAGVESAPWVGHSFGGRLLVEIAALAPERVERAALLDPALDLLPHVGFDLAEDQRRDRVFGSVEEAIEARLEGSAESSRLFVEEEAREHLVRTSDGRFRWRYCQSAVVALFGELCTPAPPPAVLGASALLVYATEFGLVRPDHLDTYRNAFGDRIELVAVPGGHMVIWDAYEQTAKAVAAFLENARP
jgi:lipase